MVFTLELLVEVQIWGVFIPLGPLKKKKQEIKLGNGCRLELLALISKFASALELSSVDSGGKGMKVQKA